VIRNSNKKPIGVFDSGYGGLTVLREIVNQLPQYDYTYLGDNARAPYGNRSFESIYHYTLECVKYLFDLGCPLIILACNTASARALRSIQQKDLHLINPDGRVLGIIRPTAEVIGNFSRSGVVGILGTNGTIASQSYPLEIEKFFPTLKVVQEACPMWVPLVENNELSNEGTDFFVQKHLLKLFEKNQSIDTILLACTHYPLLLQTILRFVPNPVKVISQGEMVAQSLKDYLQRHPKIEAVCSKSGMLEFLTTDSAELFEQQGKIFFGKDIKAQCVNPNEAKLITH
jgi:glutamate racemase